ncbi:hypothetical protein AB0945_00455 [Streptomyces sp. NPDC005474]|uniref:hypothetical protein n=1 Tax=Streptomyces sp. NPDC005474 TaxID=3154878 RepID=UPI003456D004
MNEDQSLADQQIVSVTEFRAASGIDGQGKPDRVLQALAEDLGGDRLDRGEVGLTASLMPVAGDALLTLLGQS